MTKLVARTNIVNALILSGLLVSSLMQTMLVAFLQRRVIFITLVASRLMFGGGLIDGSKVKSHVIAKKLIFSRLIGIFKLMQERFSKLEIVVRRLLTVIIGLLSILSALLCYPFTALSKASDAVDLVLTARIQTSWTLRDGRGWTGLMWGSMFIHGVDGCGWACVQRENCQEDEFECLGGHIARDLWTFSGLAACAGKDYQGENIQD